MTLKNTVIGLPARLRLAIDKRRGRKTLAQYLRDLAARDCGDPKLADVKRGRPPRDNTKGG